MTADKPTVDVEGIVEEFDRLTNGENVEGYDLYGKGSYTEWLKNNPDKHLFEFEVYGEPMLDVSAERVKDWLRTTLTTLLNQAEEENKDKNAKAYEQGVSDERIRIENVFKRHVPPHPLDLEDSVWLKRLLNKAFGHDKGDN